MKRILSIVLLAAAAIALSSCSEGKGEPAPSPTPDTSSASPTITPTPQAKTTTPQAKATPTQAKATTQPSKVTTQLTKALRLSLQNQLEDLETQDQIQKKENDILMLQAQRPQDPRLQEQNRQEIDRLRREITALRINRLNDSRKKLNQSLQALN